MVRRGIPILTKRQSDERIKLLRAQGYRIKRLRIPGGTLILKSKGRSIRACHRCGPRRKRRR